MKRTMKIRVYKRTHKGDPDENGIFGHQACMGRFRDWDCDAVIGIGGKAPWREHADIAGKINWIGIGRIELPLPTGHPETDNGETVVGFKKFLLLDEKGPRLLEHYPLLHEHMLTTTNRRQIKSDDISDELYETLMSIIDLARDATPSPGLAKMAYGEPSSRPCISSKGGSCR